MRATLNLNDDLLDRARRLSRIEDTTALLHAGLEALIGQASAGRLAALGGKEKRLKAVRRRRIR